jgi:phytoene/squalene synthetase
LNDIKTIRKSINYCRSIARRANANFSYAAALLPLKKRDFFYSTYAAMRIIDDLIDEDFLLLDGIKRKQHRTLMHTKLNCWLDQVTGNGAVTGPLNDSIMISLKHTVGRSNMSLSPWRDLAASLRADIDETVMNSWDDFLAYCSGATVSPATIYVYLSAAVYGRHEGYKYSLPKSPQYYSKNLAIYCYIVHILRDLAKDATGSPRLLTIPLDVLNKSGLNRESIEEELKNRSSKIISLAGSLVEKALRYKDAGHSDLRELFEFLDVRETIALKGLISVYDRLFDLAQKDSMNLMLNGPTIETKIRKGPWGI